MKSIAVSVLLFLIAHSEYVEFPEEAWQKHKKEYQLVFPPREEKQRRDVFAANLRIIKEHNAKDLGFKLGVNRFAHWTNDEYRMWLGSSLHTRNEELFFKPARSISNKKKFDPVDWRANNLVTNIKNQGQCGSCWAFSTVGQLEAQYANKTKQLESLSPQELVDCSEKYGNQGCNGGLMVNSFEYVRQNGLSFEKDYPYVGHDKECEKKGKKVAVKVREFREVPSQDETALVEALVEYGPISIGFDASGIEFQLYHSGIYSTTECSYKLLNHGMLLVGIANVPEEYYIVKNSWGTGWGEQGYVRVARNKKNMCGIATMASYSFIE